jgi:hypothetical protein
MLIERLALRLVFLELIGIARFLGTKVTPMSGRILRWLDRLTERPNCLLGLFQSLPSFF